MNKIVNERYIIHEALGRGGMGAVYSATDRLTNTTVALKRVLPPAHAIEGMTPTLTEPSSPTVLENFDLRIALAREFQTLATLRHPHIIDVLDYGFDNDRLPFYTMRLLKNHRSVLEAGRALGYLARIDLVVQMLTALAYLHQRGILHRDIKPNNVLYADEHIYLVDFGLAQTAALDVGPVGSVPYVAPEILLGETATQAADIYAVGVILYQLLVGKHPFDYGGISFIDNVLYNDADLDAITDISEQLTEASIDPHAIRYVIKQMLAKDADQRFPEAEGCIQALAQCTHYRLAIQTVEIRQSMVQAPTFIGREKELATLNDALTAALGGAGSAWLIGGESGVGKSRLIEELRIRALVEGALVVRGQAKAEGGARHVWEDISRRLALSAKIPLEEIIRLRAIVPDIYDLLNVPSSTIFDKAASTDTDHIARLWLTLFSNQARPVVVIMEDLHWASTEDLRVFQRLHYACRILPVLWVGTYRDDEAPALPKRLTGATPMKINRFEIEETAALCEAILGKIGRDPRLLDLLERETGGNAFLIVEIIRGLVNQAGPLASVIPIDIPGTLRTATAQALIQRRLDHIPQVHRPLLIIAALTGRELDLQLLQTMVHTTTLNAWLTDNLNAAVLTRIDDKWYFAHDQLRQGILDYYATDDTTLKAMHLQIGHAIEQVYGDVSNKAHRLAYHFAEAGDPQKARHYNIVAGEHFMQANSPAEALPYLQHCIALMNHPDLPQWSALRRAHIYRLLGDAYYYVGDAEAARDNLIVAAELLDERVPQNPFQLRHRLQEEILQQYRTQAENKRVVPHTSTATPRLLEVIRVLDRLAEVTILLSEVDMGQYAGLRAINLAEQAGVLDMLAQLYATSAQIFHLQGDFVTGRGYSRLAVFMARAIDNQPIEGWAWLQRATIAMFHADWVDLRVSLDEARDIFDALNDPRRKEEVLTLQAFVENEHHANLDAALKTRQAAAVSARRRGDDRFLIWALNGQAEINIRRFDQLQTAIRQTEQAMRIARERQQRESVRALGISALAYYYLGDYDAALNQALACAEAVTTLPPNSAIFWRVSGMDAALQVLYRLQAMTVVDQSRVAAAIGHLQYRLNQLTLIIPLAEVYAQRWLGTRAAKTETLVRAASHWQNSLDLAAMWQLPLQYARTLVEYGRHLTGDARQQKLDDAEILFNSCEATTNMLYIRNLREQA